MTILRCPAHDCADHRLQLVDQQGDGKQANQRGHWWTLSDPDELYPRPMRLDFGTVLLCGVPGLIVWAIGQILVFARFFRGRRKLPLGLRLTMAGIGLSLLGMSGAIVVAALAAGLWPVAVVVTVLFGWQPVLFFWLSTRPRVTTEEPS